MTNVNDSIQCFSSALMLIFCPCLYGFTTSSTYAFFACLCGLIWVSGLCRGLLVRCVLRWTEIFSGSQGLVCGMEVAIGCRKGMVHARTWLGQEGPQQAWRSWLGVPGSTGWGLMVGGKRSRRDVRTRKNVSRTTAKISQEVYGRNRLTVLW